MQVAIASPGSYLTFQSVAVGVDPVYSFGRGISNCRTSCSIADGRRGLPAIQRARHLHAQTLDPQIAPIPFESRNRHRVNPAAMNATALAVWSSRLS
jgi:hypothetical protein